MEIRKGTVCENMEQVRGLLGNSFFVVLHQGSDGKCELFSDLLERGWSNTLAITEALLEAGKAGKIASIFKPAPAIEEI